MLFDCVRVNTGLGFHWICNSEKKRGGGICKLMMLLILNHFSFFDLLVVFDWWTHTNRDVTLPFWVIGKVECDESNEGGWDHIWSSGCGKFFYHESYCDERVVMTIYEFQMFCDVSSGGWGYALIGHMGGVYLYMGTPQRHGFFGGLKRNTPYYSHDRTHLQGTGWIVPFDLREWNW
jgi:hypothetical protein